jgi:hypothetical protein
VHALLHFGLAGSFVWLYGRRIGLAPAPALAASLAYIGSGPLVDATHNSAYLSTFTWLPAVFWALERLIAIPRAGPCALLAATLALGFLAGHAQGFLYLAVAFGLYAAFRLAAGVRGEPRIRLLPWLAAAGTAALGLVAIQLLPTLAHVRDAVRSIEGLEIRQAGMYPALGSWLDLALSKTQGGIPVLAPLLAMVGLVLGDRRRVLFFLALGALVFDFMRGLGGVSFPVFYELPGGNVFRIPVRAAFVYQFAVAMLVGLGGHACSKALVRAGARRAATTVAIALPLLVGGEALLRHPLRHRFEPLVEPESLYASEDVLSLASRAAPDRLFVERRNAYTVPPKLGTLHGVFALPDYEPALPGAYAQFFGLPPGETWHGELDVVDFDARRKRLRVAPSLLDLLSVRYYVDGMPGRGHGALGRAVAGVRIRGGEDPVFARRSFRPRVYVVHDALAVPSPEEALARVRALDFDPARQAVVVSREPLQLGPARRRERAELTRYRQNRVEVEARCATNCLLVLTDLYDPDWQVRVDGSPAPLLRTNFLVRGVQLTPGVHEIEFRYRPSSFMAGAAVSVATTALLALWLGISRARRGAVRSS